MSNASRSLSDVDKVKQKNQKTYDALSREYNKLYIGQSKSEIDIKHYDDDIFDGQLINESCVLQVIEHGKYNDIDALKRYNVSNVLSRTKKSHFPLDVPVIHLSGRIGYDSFMMPDEQIEETVPIIGELQYNSLLTPINRQKQIQKVAHKLRLLHKKYLKVQIQELKDKMKRELQRASSHVEMIEQYKENIKLLQREIKEIYGFFNPYSFKAGQQMNKYLTLFEGPDAPEEGRVRGIFGLDGEEYFHSYVEKYGCYEGDNGVPFKMIHLGDFLHYCYERMDRTPKYFIIVDHSCSSIGLDLTNQISPTKFTTHFYNKHLSVQKRSFSKKTSKKFNSL